VVVGVAAADRHGGAFHDHEGFPDVWARRESFVIMEFGPAAGRSGATPLRWLRRLT
jgi:hypothetical protein